MSFPALIPVTRENTMPAWVGPMVVAAFLQAVLMVGYAARFGGDPSIFVCAASGAAGEYPFERIHSTLSKDGHDGQLYYVIARSPFQRQDSRYIIDPCYRHVRILYPAMAWLFSGGDAERLLWVMPAINGIAVVALAGLGAAFALRLRRSPWWGLFLPIALNAATPGLRDLTDPLAMLCGFALLSTWLSRGRSIVLMLLAIAAALSREQNVALIGMVLIAALLGRNWKAAIAMSLALMIWTGWVLYLNHLYGAWPYISGHITQPFGGMMYRMEHLHGQQSGRTLPIHAAGLLWIILQVVVAFLMPFLRADRTICLTAIAGAALAILGGSAIYMDGHSYTRVFVFLPLGIWLWAVHSGRRWPALVLAPALVWPCYALFQVWHR